MKIIPFEALYNTEVLISEPISKTQSWAARGNVFNALGKPKISHTLLWFKNCSATITDADGGVLEVSKNQLTYMAKGTEYRVDFKDTVPDRVDTIVVHFQMTDKTGEDVAPVLHPVICFKNVDLSHALVLDELAEECKKNIVCLPLVASVIYKLLADICQKQKSSVTKNKFACIRSGIELLEQDSDLSIADIAFRCRSEERRVGKECL